MHESISFFFHDFFAIIREFFATLCVKLIERSNNKKEKQRATAKITPKRRLPD